MKKKHLQPLTPAALYARVSSDRQDVDLSVSAQLRALKDYAKANGDPPSSQAISAQSSPTEHQESANQRLRLHDRSPTCLSSTQVEWRKLVQSLGYSPRTIKVIG